MAACVAITLPLEIILGARVYRSWRRLVVTLLVVAPPFLFWDAVAVARRHWWFSNRYTTGWLLPGAVPVEELVFFVVVPICGLLTYEAVRTLLDRQPDA